ncbi:hypothetical protein Cha6605_3438 [Chamaesiphon minutus PCC 6605]|uniref:Uncharacterized protein n=1 Tax=Chamaesiphon minutus (strain ATCC 27169 / PCC 6605) TaxID=1173020 RepID=K9UHZ3_CHAP6|nr:hypothetical protein Cha6605_3438 [Chamaesiphon minutus PCC 6605]
MVFMAIYYLWRVAIWLCNNLGLAGTIAEEIDRVQASALDR